MAKSDTVERYRTSVSLSGRRYKLLAHQVLEDETLAVEVRSKPLKNHMASGALRLDAGELTIANGAGRDDGGAHHVHYHPSGRLRIKAFDGSVVRELSLPPLPVLHRPVPLLMMSVASVDQLDLDDKKTVPGDHEFNLDAMKVQRLEAVAWIGPKGSLTDLRPINFPAQKVLYEDAALYDFAYMVGEAVPIKDLRVSDTASLRDTRITSYINEDVPPIRPIPKREPEYWASPGAIARQLRATLESDLDYAREKLASAGAPGAWEARISLCRDGFIVALDWNYTWQHPGYSMAEWYALSVGDVLRVLDVVPAGSTRDVYGIDPSLTGSLQRIAFVRAAAPASGPSLHNAVVLLPVERLQDRYYRVPRVVLKNLKQIMGHVRYYPPPSQAA